MGADLYIRSLHDAAEAKYLPIFNEAVKARDEYSRATYGEAGPPRDRETGKVLDDDRGKELQAAVHEAYEKMYEENAGYFRDSYNPSSLFHLIDLSWWKNDWIKKNVSADEAYPEISVADAQRLLTEIESKEITPGMVAAMLNDNRERLSDDTDLNAWTTYFQEKRERFIAFLKRAIALNEPIRASV